MATPYIALQPSERVLLQAAAQIYAAYVTSGHVTSGKEEEYLTKAVQQSIQLARKIDDAVQADKEIG